ncbi:hypothetical protein [Microcoleus asticus]|uniref:S1 motif domain-containing protein n=1 Tax=Microcoleus asticus IPMA8 TaxID=2563858 RepID=A0ABX2CXI5_9CYAN|nr:hypothetical protein [Microcoleus asticus]NQE35129.1 hypothetical protein [Microcoleus asticus IPMA8]
MSNTELVTESLTENQWGIAHAIAQTLVKEQTDVNELGKAIAYLRNAVNQNQADANSRFFKYLKTLVGNGRQIGHSSKTTDYYRSIDKACSDCLKGFQGDASTLLQILGWASRLMRYYKEAGPIGEVVTPVVESARQVEIAKAIGSHEFAIGQIVEAKVTAVKGNKVTYEILGTIRLTEKKPKKAQSLSEKQMVKVEILDLKEDSSIRKVKLSE